MNILVIGNETNRAEIDQKFAENNICEFAANLAEATPFLKWAEVVFDFVSDNSSMLKVYEPFALPVFLNTTFTTLADLAGSTKSNNTFIGFCGNPTFVNRELLEVCLLNEHDLPVLEKTCNALQTQYGRVSDQVGFVTPRIICMIINEAYYTVEEGTASRSDIDLAMKLGTNYPYGPFEWAQRIGIGNVVLLLEKIYQATHDERYMVCSLLKSEKGLI